MNESGHLLKSPILNDLTHPGQNTLAIDKFNQGYWNNHRENRARQQWSKPNVSITGGDMRRYQKREAPKAKI